MVCARFWGGAKWWFFIIFQLFARKLKIPSKTQEYSLRFPQLFAFFGPARPGCARPYKTNAIPSLFRGSWRPGAHFHKKSLFHKIITKVEKSDFLADIGFFNENHDFREIHRLAKTPVFLVVYQWFWRVDGLENAKITKFTKMLGFL